MKTADDDRLVSAAQGGDFAAFERLVGRHEQPLYRLAMGIVRQCEDAEDVVQATLMSALEHLNEFRGEAAFATWIRRIASNKALNVLRKKRGLPMAGKDCPDDDADCLPHPQFIADWRTDVMQTVQRQEVRRILDAAMDDLPDHHRVVFVMRDVEGMSTKETAETLGISEANVKVRLLRARLVLREKLTEVFGDETKRITVDHHHDDEGDETARAKR
jgi:RNA polymerase sigma-70 factor (ECF subfamily)